MTSGPEIRDVDFVRLQHILHTSQTFETKRLQIAFMLSSYDDIVKRLIDLHKMYQY